jgi:hypothetical protein
MRASFVHFTRWLVVAVVCSQAVVLAKAEGTSEAGLAREVAGAYGIARWDEVEALSFTFHVKTPDRVVMRRWTWLPKEDRVTLTTEGAEPITYRRDELGDDAPHAARQADRQFVNDSYWLLFPFQLVWSNPDITDGGEAALPIGEGVGRKLVVRYPDEGGYTPGDAYDLYLDDANMIVQWDFRKGGGEIGRAVAWESNVDLGPIKVCVEHRGPDDSFRLWFSGLKVTTDDGEEFEAE